MGQQARADSWEQDTPRRAPLDMNQLELTRADAGRDDSSSSVDHLAEIQQFSIVQGGPLFELLSRGHFVGAAMTLVTRRITLFVLITWVPLLVLSALDGHSSTSVLSRFHTLLFSIRSKSLITTVTRIFLECPIT